MQAAGQCGVPLFLSSRELWGGGGGGVAPEEERKAGSSVQLEDDLLAVGFSELGCRSGGGKESTLLGV